MPRTSQQGTGTNTVESHGSDQEVPKQRLGFAQDLGKECLQEIPFVLLGRFADTCRGKDLTTVADQGTNVYVVHPPCVQAIMRAVSTENFQTVTELHKVSLIFIVTMHQ